MAVEVKRGCGYRKVGGLYLTGTYIPVECDRLPMPVSHCPTCGAGIHFTRSMTEINPFRLFGNHEGQSIIIDDGVAGTMDCRDQIRPCKVCDPPDDIAFVMMVGVKYYPTVEDFAEEAFRLGICKRIPFKPKKLTLGQTIIYLAHPKACTVREPVVVQQVKALVGGEEETNQPRLVDAEKQEKTLGIFCAFIPQKIEKLVWESELTDEAREKLEKQGITPVPIPDGDGDHR